MKRLFLVGVICLMAVSWGNAAGTDAERVEAFIQVCKKLPVQERIQRAQETIQNSDDEAIVCEAARDLARFSKTAERAEEALATIDALIDESDPNSDYYKKGQLAKARVLARLDRTEEAQNIFKKAIAECWYEDVDKEYYEAFSETGDYALLAVNEYEKHTSDEYSAEVKAYFGFGGDLCEMLCYLRGLRSLDSELSAMETILPQLGESKGRPMAKKIAEVFCLATDSRYEEAHKLLDEIEGILESEKNRVSNHDESKDLPLYRAAILLFEGHDYDAMRLAMQSYIENRYNNPQVVLRNVLSLTYVLELKQDNLKRIAELTAYFLISDIITNTEIRNSLQRKDLASLYAMHLVSVDRRKQLLYARKLAQQLVTEFYPDTLGGKTGALYSAAYLMCEQKNEEAQKILLDLIQEYPADSIMAQAKSYLALLWYNMNTRDEESLALIQDVKDLIGIDENGRVNTKEDSLSRIQIKRIQELESRLLQRISGGQYLLIHNEERYPEWGFEYK